MPATPWVPLLFAVLVGATVLTASGHAGHIAELEQRFAVADKDHDGKLTREEARAAGMTSVVRDFTLIDKDKQGFVTLDQLKARLRAKGD